MDFVLAMQVPIKDFGLGRDSITSNECWALNTGKLEVPETC